MTYVASVQAAFEELGIPFGSLALAIPSDRDPNREPVIVVFRSGEVPIYAPIHPLTFVDPNALEDWVKSRFG